MDMLLQERDIVTNIEFRQIERFDLVPGILNVIDVFISYGK